MKIVKYVTLPENSHKMICRKLTCKYSFVRKTVLVELSPGDSTCSIKFCGLDVRDLLKIKMYQ